MEKDIKSRDVTVLAIIILVSLTYFIIMHISTWHNIISLARKFGTTNMVLARHAYFSGRLFVPTFKYFIAAFADVVLTLGVFFKFKQKLLGLLCMILTVWLFVSSLQLYYSILTFHTVMIIAIACEFAAISLTTLILTRRKIED